MKHHRVIAAIFLSVIFASCVIETPIESDPPEPVAATTAEQPTEPETVVPPETETVPQEEPVKETVIDPVTTDIPTTDQTKPVEPKPVALRQLPSYHAYILDKCGALWGIPTDLQGEYDKVHLTIETADGVQIPSSELDLFSIDGILYITRTHTVDGNPAIDYYRQDGDTIALVDSVPAKPEESRVHLDSPAWLIETSVISGTEYSYLYNRDADMIQKQGNSGGKGAFMRRYDRISGYAVLDRGVLVMTESGAFFYPVNRACGNAVSEYGRLWK